LPFEVRLPSRPAPSGQEPISVDSDLIEKWVGPPMVAPGAPRHHEQWHAEGQAGWETPRWSSSAAELASRPTPRSWLALQFAALAPYRPHL